MINIDKDYLITVDLKNTKVKSDKTIFFYNTDLNICNIFIKLICTDEDKTIPEDLIVELAVLKPETDEFKPLDATLISKEDLLYQVDLTTDYFDIVGKYSCEIRVSGTIENELKCFTSEEFDYVVKPNITAKLDKKIKNDKNLPVLEKLIKDVKEVTDGINKNEIQMKRDENLVGDNKTVVGAINQLREDVNSGIGGGTAELKDYQKKNDEFLNTDEKTITGGINEVNNKIKKVQESQIELDKDDVSFNGIDDISHDELNTTNKTLIGAINEVNTQCKDIAKQIENIGTGGGSTNTGIPTFLKGKKYIAIGDSIVENQGTTANPTTYSGTDLQGIVHTEEVVKGYIQEIENRYGLVCTNLGKGGHTIVNDYADLMNINYSDVALVTIAYGCNDARLSVPLGTVNSSDGTTFAGALNNILRKIYTDNPECRVIVLTALQRLYVSEFGIATANSNGNYLIDFVDMCKKVANKRSTKCIDVYRDCGINQTNLYYYTREGVHPLNTGYKRMSGAIIPVLDDMLSIEFNPFGTMTNTGDTEPEEPNPGGGGSGGDTPTEDPKATVVDISTLFTNTGYIYDNWGNVKNNSLYQYTTPIELINGKTYTLITIVQSDFSTPYGCVTNTSTDFSTHKSINAGVTSENVTINGTVYKQITATITVPSSEDTYYIWINKFKAIDVSKCSLSYV